MAQNPVITKFGQASGGNRLPTPSVGDLNDMFNKPAYAGPTGSGRYMTLDDVVQRTGAMLGVLLVAGGAAWVLTPDRLALPVLLISLMGGLALGLYMSFSMKVNAVNAVIYSAFEGVLLGTISKLFNNAYPGIVIQAITGTVMVAGGMLFVYKIGAIRVTPKFTRVVLGATLGLLGLMVVNMLAYLFHPGGLGLRDGGTLAIVFSLVCIVIASMNLVVDFDMIEQGIRNGADEKFAWYASFALMVTLIWLYIEILRLLSYFARR
ncbi:MAG: Bax inhibitor-1/YccA family protein [Pseudonocardiales bacterium]|nr:Bax inhibitor-1/YccA family protein [Actinomycetota bacterium]